MAARDAPSRQSDPDEYISSKPFGDSHALARSVKRRNSDLEFSRRQCREPSPQQVKALLHLADTNPDARIHVAVLQHRHVKRGAAIRRIWNIAAGIEVAPRCSSDKSPRTPQRNQLRCNFPGSAGPVLQRWSVVVKAD